MSLFQSYLQMLNSRGKHAYTLRRGRVDARCPARARRQIQQVHRIYIDIGVLTIDSKSLECVLYSTGESNTGC